MQGWQIKVWCVVVSCSLLAQAATAGDWPQFLGPQRTGISTETGLISKWPTGGPAEVWKSEVGPGMSGVAIGDGRLVTLVQVDGEQQALALDAATGKRLWSIKLAEAYENGQGDGPRSTPTLTAEAIYVYTGNGVLLALKPDSGEVLWQSEVVAKSGGDIADYGMTSSPLVVKNLVIVTAGAPDAGVVAFDRLKGTMAWKAGKGPAGYSSPALRKIGETEQVVAFLGAATIGIEPATGKVLWNYPYATDFDCNISTPLAIGNDVFLSSGENHGSVLLALKDSGGKLKPEPVWASQGPSSTLRSEWQTPVLLEGYLYGFDNVGSAGPVTHLTCIEARTGKRMWQKLRFGKGNLIAADGKLWMTTMKGELVVAEASPNEYRELGRATLLETTRQAPALANGFLFLRDGVHVLCLDVRGK